MRMRQTILGVVTGLVVGMLLLATRGGIGLSPDSLVYGSVAENIIRGNGWLFNSSDGTCSPLHGYPLLFPTILALILHISGGDMSLAGRTLAAMALAAAAFFANRILWNLAVRNILVRAGCLLALLALPDTLHVFAMLNSEMLFVPLALASVWLLDGMLTGGKPLTMAGLAFVLMAAILTRFEGVWLLLTAVGLGGYCRKWQPRPAWFVLIALLAAVLLFTFGHSLVGDATIGARQIAWHPPTLRQLITGCGVVSKWLLPQEVAVPWRALLTGGAALAFMRLLRLPPTVTVSVSYGRMATILLVCIVAKTLFALVTITFFDAYAGFEHRHMLLLYWFGFLWLSGTVSRRWRYLKQGARCMLTGLAVVLIAVMLVRALLWTHEAMLRGIGLTRVVTHESALLGMIAQMPEQVKLYSNAPDLIYYFTGCPANLLPTRQNPSTLEMYDDFAGQCADVVRTCGEGKLAIVWFNRVDWRHYLPAEYELFAGDTAAVIGLTADGTIYCGEEKSDD